MIIKDEINKLVNDFKTNLTDKLTNLHDPDPGVDALGKSIQDTPELKKRRMHAMAVFYVDQIIKDVYGKLDAVVEKDCLKNNIKVKDKIDEAVLIQ
jgi:hypothetical protein